MERIIIYDDVLVEYLTKKERIIYITNPSAKGDYSICSQITSKTAATSARILEGSLNITG